MNQYFFKMSQAEKNNILDQHKTIYDGFVTQFGQQSNTQPLYVQDFANDKGGIVVTNKGDIKTYTNVGINESHSMLDRIADGPDDLENGTVDFNDVENDDDYEFFSAGSSDDYKDRSMYDPYYDDEEDFSDIMNIGDDYLEDEEHYEEEFSEEDEEIDFDDKLSMELIKDVPDDLKEEFIVKLDESLSMFKRIIK